MSLSLLDDSGMDDFGHFDASTAFDSVVPVPCGSPGLGLDVDDLGLGLHDLKTSDLLPDVAGIQDVLCDEEPFSFLDDTEWQRLEQGGGLGMAPEEEPVRSDLMWSATASNQDAEQADKSAAAAKALASARWRNVSLTLSECADSLFSDVDLDASPEGIAKILGADSGNRLKQELEDEEEEDVDVVSDTASSVSTESAESSVSHRHWQQHFRAKHQQQQQQQRNARPTVAAGRSVLRSKQHQRGKVAPTQSGSAAPLDHSLLDHAYFSTSGPPSPSSSSVSSPSSPMAFTNGLLTPNESSDDEDLLNGSNTQFESRKRRRSETATGPGSKRARHEDSNDKLNAEKVKFKFRMAFKPNHKTTKSQRSLLNSNTAAGSKRRSALKNAHCPSPTKSSPQQTGPVNQRLEGNAVEEEDESSPAARTSTGRRSKYAGVTSDQKCREIRDLHNSMERQRRVDLKNHFDILKDQVPELKDNDKASKLCILNSATNHCNQLTVLNGKMDAEKSDQYLRLARNKKLLAQLYNSFPNSKVTKNKAKRTSSGRVSVLSSKVY